MIEVNQAVIFVGGLGTRLGKLTKRIPKPLIKVCKKPFIEHLILFFARQGIKEIILLSGYKKKLFKKKYHNKIFFNTTKVICCEEVKSLGTGGALLNAKKLLKKNFFLCNGDTYFDFNLQDLPLNIKKNSLIKLAVAKINTDNNRFLSIQINKGNILNFTKEKKNTKLINSGYYFVKKKLLSKIKKKICSLEEDIFPELIRKKKIEAKPYIQKLNKFIDIGVPKDLKNSAKFMQGIKKKKAIFLDRDGVINKDFGYVHNKDKILWRKNIFKFMNCLKNKNFLVFVITNQSGIGRGYYTEKDLKILHKWMNSIFLKNGSYIDKFYYSPYYQFSKFNKFRKNKSYRKPNIGLFKLAKKEFNFIINKSYMIGDSISDIEFARNCNLKGFKVNFSDDIIKLLNKLN